MQTGYRLFWLSFFIAAIAALAGWSAVESRDNLRICKASLMALNSAEANIHVQRVTTSSFSRIVRLDYDVAVPGRRMRVNRFVTCRFAPNRVRLSGTELSSLDTEAGPLSEANLFMLKRFYINIVEMDHVISGEPDSGQSIIHGVAGQIGEWIAGIAPRAVLYSILASLFYLTACLFRILRPGSTYGITYAVLATLGALLITGLTARVALSMALMTGIVCGGCSLLLYLRSKTRTSGFEVTALLPWGLFTTFVLLALFWFPDFGPFGPNWLPLWLSGQLPLTEVAAISPMMMIFGVAALLMVLADLYQAGKAQLPTNNPSLFSGLIKLAACGIAAGSVTATGYMLYGLESNPLLLCTKALLIALIAFVDMGNPVRYLYIVLISVALTSLEFSMVPFLRADIVNATSYALLLLGCFLAGRMRHNVRN